MSSMDRRSFIQLAVAMGATVAWGNAKGLPSHVAWRERRDLFPEGVASADPDSSSVLLWTRPSAARHRRRRLHVEVAEDPAFLKVSRAHSRFWQNPIGPAACSSEDSNPPTFTGIALPIARIRQPDRPHDHRSGARTISRCGSPLSAARMPIRARKMHIGG